MDSRNSQTIQNLKPKTTKQSENLDSAVCSLSLAPLILLMCSRYSNPKNKLFAETDFFLRLCLCFFRLGRAKHSLYFYGEHFLLKPRVVLESTADSRGNRCGSHFSSLTDHS